jgi:hypothetical protein
MASTFNVSGTAASAMANGGSLAPLFNAGTLNIYAGTQPANANTALTTQTLLATLTFASPAFGAASSGVITANPIAAGAATASGTAAFYRCLKSDGSTVLCDGSVGTSACDLNLSTVAILLGTNVSVSSFQITVTQ